MNPENQKKPMSDPPNSTPLIPDTDGYLYGASCRICFEKKGLLISPCKCTGTTKFVHRKCLHEWLNYANNPKQCEICLTPWNETILPVYARIFYRYNFTVVFTCWALYFLTSYQIFDSARVNPHDHMALIFYIMASLILLLFHLSSFKDIRELYMHWKVMFTVVFWSLSLMKTMEDEYYKEEMFHEREKWPEENRQIDLIIVSDTIAWLITLSVYSSMVNRNNGWRTMTVV